MNDSDVTTQWRQLFRGHAVTDETLAKAQGLLKRLSNESPLRLRLAQELDEIKKLSRSQ